MLHYSMCIYYKWYLLIITCEDNFNIVFRNSDSVIMYNKISVCVCVRAYTRVYNSATKHELWQRSGSGSVSPIDKYNTWETILPFVKCQSQEFSHDSKLCQVFIIYLRLKTVCPSTPFSQCFIILIAVLKKKRTIITLSYTL